MSDQAKPTADALSQLLADSYTLYLKTHNFHWNVKGPMFSTLHTMFETEYLELALAVDEIAERIRALGFRAPGTYREFGAITKIEEPEGVPAATAMVETLAGDQDRIVAAAKQVFAAAEGAGDQASADLAAFERADQLPLNCTSSNTSVGVRKLDHGTGSLPSSERRIRISP